MIDSIVALCSRLTGRRFWYEIEVYYHNNKTGNNVSSFLEVGYTMKSLALGSRRYCAKAAGRDFHKIVRKIGGDRSIQVRYICYLGYFKKRAGK